MNEETVKEDSRGDCLVLGFTLSISLLTLMILIVYFYEQ